MDKLLRALIASSEKAANIARSIRNEEDLFNLLIQKKCDSEANPRFFEDFKTLADVLIQQSITHDVGKKFPELVMNICGEESNTFGNTLGQKITVTVMDTEAATAELLCCVLSGNTAAARLLAAEVHREIDISHFGYTAEVPTDHDLEIPIGNIAIWIDPIDSTAEYINGTMSDETSTRATNTEASSKRCGLQCVTVLVGAYDMTTGVPIMGVINQPFYKESKGRCVWGMTHNGKSFLSNNVPKFIPSADRTATIIVSSSESEAVKNSLKAVGYNIIEAAGAGYKLLTVILGETDVYLLSQATAYKWDTCGPHAILAAVGGGIFDCNLAKMGIFEQITYNNNNKGESVDNHSHRGGIVAYRDVNQCGDICAIITN